MVLRQATRHVARLARAQLAPVAAPAPDAAPVLGKAQPFRLALPVSGELDGLGLQPHSPGTPGPGQIVVEVKAASLNFRDIMLSLGLIPAPHGEILLGLECAGRISAVGSEVAGFAVGDEVISSGLGGVFPRGIPAGTVSAVSEDPADGSRRVSVEPVVDFGSLEEVFVIVGERAAEDAPPDERGTVPPTPGT